MKKIAIDKPALSFAIAVIGLVGAGVISPTMAMINASPDFYDLYRMSTWAVLVFVHLICIALPILAGMVAYIFAISQTIQWGLPLYFISLAGVAAAASIRNFVPISDPWLLVFISSMLGVLIYVAFRHLTIVRVCLIASSAALPLTMAQSISVVSNRITNSEEMSSPLLPLTPQGRLPDIVFLQLDELPLTTVLDSTGEINRNLFPNFYALASTSHWFSSMGTNYCSTRGALPAIMTGRLTKTAPWDDTEAPHFSNYPTNLFSLLSTHYDFNVHESVSQLCENSKCAAAPLPFYRNKSFRVHLVWAWLHALAPAEMRASLRNLDQLWMDAATTNVEEPKTMDLLAARAAQYERFINDLNFVPARPQLHYVHLLLPHQPFEMLPNGYVYAGPWGQFMDWKRNIWLDQTSHVHQAYFQHILQARYVDQVIGQLIDKLKSNGAFDSTVLVVTSDHGIQFQPNRGPKTVNDSSYANVVGVPLLIKSAHQVSRADHSTHTQSVDILPTLLGQIGLGIEPSVFDGRDVLMDNPEPLNERVFVCGPKLHVFPADLRTELLKEVKIRDAALGTKEEYFMNFSPRPEWIGKKVSGLGSTRESHHVLTLRQLLNPNENFVPLYLTGSLPKSKSPELRNKLFVATLNGKVASVMPSAKTREGTALIAMMLNPEFLGPGENTISLFMTNPETEGTPVFLELKMKDENTKRVFETVAFDYVEPRTKGL